jgi:transcription elongation factor Elf1
MSNYGRGDEREDQMGQWNAGTKKKHDPDRPFVCKTCGNRFHTSILLNKHMKNHLDHSVECEICKATLTSQRTLDVHMRRHGDPPFKCLICFKGYNSKANFERHMNTKHLTCEICALVLENKSELKAHKKSHDEQREMTDVYECKTCGKKFESEGNLTVHMNFHELDGFECSICNETFATNEGLTGHTRNAHNSQRPLTHMYECTTCGKKIENEKNLFVHMQFVDTPSYLCKECSIHEIVFGSTDVGASSAIDGEGINMDDVNDQTPALFGDDELINGLWAWYQTPPLFGDDELINGLLAWEHTPPVLD